MTAVKWSRGLTPYLLLGILTLGTGLGVGLGLSEASVTQAGTLEGITESIPFSFGSGMFVPNHSKMFNACLAKVEAAVATRTSYPSE